MKSYFYYFVTVMAVMVSSFCGVFLLRAFLPGDVSGQAVLGLADYTGATLTISRPGLRVEIEMSNLVNLGFSYPEEGNANLDSQKILSHLSLITQNTPQAFVRENVVYNCEGRNYNFPVNNEKVAMIILDALQSNQEAILSLDDIYSNPEDAKAAERCEEYNATVKALNEKLLQEAGSGLDFASFVNPRINPAASRVEVQELALEQAIQGLSRKVNTQAHSGRYEVIEDKVFLFEPYVYGAMINTELTKRNIYDAFNNGVIKESVAVIEQDIPGVLSLGLKVYDFTQLLAEGKTRIDTGRGIHQYGQYGVEEMNNKIIQPGKEFSFNKAIAPQPNGTTISGKPIAGGICNATTTLFRAALEAGLPITRRKSHGFYVKSYDWGYPLNIVEATYWPNKVDLRFKNDYSKPILLRSEIRNTGEWQYHTIKVYGAAEETKREVEFKNWQTWRNWSTTLFSGSVERVVRQAGKVILKDKIVTEYY